MTNHYFEHNTQAISDKNQVEALAREVEQAFLQVETDLWDDSVKKASIGSSIGDVDPWYIKDYDPSKGIINTYEQDLYFPKFSKEASLDLIPERTPTALNRVVIKNRINPSQVYTYKHDGLLTNEYDFCFVGRKLVLGKTPANDKILSIVYSGYEPVDAGDVGLDLRYNILQVNNNGVIQREFINTHDKPSGLYSIEGYNFKSMCSKDIIRVIDNEPYNLERFVTIVDIDETENFKVRNINITNTKITFESDEVIPEKVKIFVANSSLGKLIEGVYRLFYSHDHGDNGGKLLSHASMVGLFSNINGIDYSVTNKENYEHPQYLNREGYIEAPEVYNNALLGDLLVASKDKSNYYNNLSSDSFKIIFGEYASGHRIGYSKNVDSLVIDSLSRDGVKIVSPKNKNILGLNDHVVTDLVDGEFSGVQLSIVPLEVGLKEYAVFSVKTLAETEAGIVHEDSAEIQSYSSKFSVTTIKDELNLLEKAILTFGDNKLITATTTKDGLVFQDTSRANSQSVSFKLPLHTETLYSEHINAKEVHITDTQKIVFGKEGSKESLTHTPDTGVVLSLNKPVAFKENGFNSGLAFGKSNKIFAGTSQGINTTNTSERLDNYFLSSGDNYFVKGAIDFNAGGVNLQAVPKANVHLNSIYADNVDIRYSEGSINSLRMNGDSHRMFTQKDALGNTAVHIQTTGGLNVVSSYNVSSTDVKVSYGTIRASEYRAEGGDSAGFYGNVIVPTGSSLTVNGKTAINSALELSNNLTVKGVSKLSTLETSTVKTGTISASESIVTPLITAPLGVNSKIFIGSDISFNNSAMFRQVCTFTSNCEFQAAITANTVTTKFLYVASTVDFPKVITTEAEITGQLQFKRMLQTDPNTTSEFSGNLIMKGGASLDRGATLRIGSLDIANTRNTSGILLTENAVKMGNNSTVKTSKVFANKGLPVGGNSDVIGGYSFETNLGASDGDTGFFCTNKGSSSMVDDLVFMINGTKLGEISTAPLDMTKSIAGREKTLVTAEMVKGQFDGMGGSVLQQVYPLGTIYMNASDNRNPKEILNWPSSVWTRTAVGMALVGAEGNSNSEKMAAMWNQPSNIQLVIEKEFGSFTHKLVKSELPAESVEGVVTATGHSYAGDSGRAGGEALHGIKLGSVTASGMDKPHNNVQPSRVVAIWRRVG